jgi:hypothetical protein
VLPLANGPVVLGLSSVCHTPLSGQVCPVVRVVPMGIFATVVDIESVPFRLKEVDLDALIRQQ